MDRRKQEEEEAAKADHHHHHTHHHHHHHHAQQPLLCVDKHKIQEAAFCIKDAIDCLIRPHPAPVPNAQWAYKLRLRPLGYLLPWLAIWTLIVLTFFERPSWCDADDAAERCDPGSSISKLYIRVTESFLPHMAGFLVEFLALFILAVDYLLQMMSEGQSFLRLHPMARGFSHQCLLILSFINLLLSAIFETQSHWVFRGGPFLRILFLVVYSRRLRQEMKLVARMFLPFGRAVVLLVVFLLLYAILGLSLFSPDSGNLADSEEASIYFPDFATSFKSVFQLFLYWIFPTIMVLKGKEPGEYLPPNAVLCVFVFSFMIITVYFILSLALAIVYDVYTEHSRDREKQRKGDRKASLEKAFLLLCQPSPSSSSSPPPPRRITLHVMEAVLGVASNFASVPSLSRRCLNDLLNAMDQDKDGCIRKPEFIKLPDLLLHFSRQQRQRSISSPRRVNIHERGRIPAMLREEDDDGTEGETHPDQYVDEQEEEEEEDEDLLRSGRARFVDLWCPRFAASSFFHKFCAFVKSSFLEYFIDAIIIANLALALAAHGKENRDNNNDNKHGGGGGGSGDDETGDIHQGKTLLSQQDFSIFCAVVFSIEVASKLLVYGWRRYISSAMNVFDAVLTVLTVGAAIYELGGWAAENNHHTLLIFELLRILRLFRALLAVPQFRTTANTFVKILPSASSLFLHLFTVTFVFAAAGLEAFGGLVNRDPAQPQFSKLKPTYYYKHGYYVFNWNCLGGCFIVLVELLIDSSLIQPFFEALSAVMKNEGRAWLVMVYFVLYYCVGQLMVLNILVAFILDAFMYEENESKEEGEEGEEEDDRQGQGHREAGGGGGGGGGMQQQQQQQQKREEISTGGGGGGGGEEEGRIKRRDGETVGDQHVVSIVHKN